MHDIFMSKNFMIFEFIELFLFIFFIALIPEGVAALLSPSKFDIMFMHIGFNISF